MFAKELLGYGAVVSLALMEAGDTTLQGADPLTIAAITHDRIQREVLV